MKDIKFILDKHNSYFENTLSFIPSENSGFIFDSLGKSEISNRYFFKNELYKKSFPGKKYIDEIYEYVESKLKNLLKIEYINLAPLSGLTQMTLVLKSFLNKESDTVLGLPVSKGGHYSTKRLVESLGYRFLEIPFSGEEIDNLGLTDLINKNNVGLVYIDQMTGSFPIKIDFSIKDKLNKKVIFYNDISHNLAFIISGINTNLIDEGYDAFGGSFHKSFPGPQKAFVGTNTLELSKIIDDNAEILFSSIHFGSIYDLGLVLDYMDEKWENYTKDILINTNLFGKVLEKLGFEIIGSNGEIYSKNHQLLFSMPRNINPDVFAKCLEEVGILVNSIFLPFTNGKKGIRMGFQEVTLLGITKNNLIDIIKIFNGVLDGNYDSQIYRNKVLEIKNNLTKI